MKALRRFLSKPDWKNLRTTKPISTVFGLDRGSPVDRFYIEKFLEENKAGIKGNVLEVAEDTYTKRFGQEGTRSMVLQYQGERNESTLLGDLTNHSTLPENEFDCFICTQTLNFIYDFNAGIAGIKKLLKKDGVALVTLAGLCQISRYDMDRWGDFWRFTTASGEKIFADAFGKDNVSVKSYGNVLTAVALLHGISQEELKEEELLEHDPNYQIVISIVARKC